MSLLFLWDMSGTGSCLDIAHSKIPLSKTSNYSVVQDLSLPN